MSPSKRAREVGRGERVLPGVWRLRLPLPWPGIPHGNAWALAAGDGIVLVDTGIQEPGSLAHLERALDQVGLRLEHVRLVVLTHAHRDHCGQAVAVAERTGCEIWVHPRHEHAQPDIPLRMDRPLTDGVTVDSDLGAWRVVETPGHAPSHVCLWQPERRLLFSGDHVLGRVSLYFDHGWTPDPVAEFLASLDRVQALDVRLCLAGHGRTFTDIDAHVEAYRKLVRERLDAVRTALAAGAETPEDVARRVYGDALDSGAARWLLTKTRSWLTHLERAGAA